jgi:hypothetical protein
MDVVNLAEKFSRFAEWSPTEHCPLALAEDVHVLLLEPKTTLNTGNVVNERTVPALDRL